MIQSTPSIYLFTRDDNLGVVILFLRGVHLEFPGLATNVTQSLLNDSETAFQENNSALWMIRDPADHMSDVESQNLPRPKISFQACESCLKGTAFHSEVEATAHLRWKHFFASKASNTGI